MQSRSQTIDSNVDSKSALLDSSAPAEGTRSHDDIEPKDDSASGLKAKSSDKSLESSSSSGGKIDVKSRKLDLKDASSAEAKLLVDIIVQEHDLAASLYEQYQQSTDLKQKLTLGRQIVDAIVEHAGKEEIALYSAMRDIPSLGDTEVEQAKAEHLQVTKDLYKLDKMTEANDEYDALLNKIMTELTEHIADEESRLLPLFAKDVDPSKAKDILNSYTGAVVTTRPHPAAPHEGLAAAAAQAMSLPLDKAVDAVRGTPSMAKPKGKSK